MSNKIDYKLRKDLEGSGSHIVVLDLVGAANHRIIQILQLNLKKAFCMSSYIFIVSKYFIGYSKSFLFRNPRRIKFY